MGLKNWIRKIVGDTDSITSADIAAFQQRCEVARRQALFMTVAPEHEPLRQELDRIYAKIASGEVDGFTRTEILSTPDRAKEILRIFKGETR